MHVKRTPGRTGCTRRSYMETARSRDKIPQTQWPALYRPGFEAGRQTRMRVELGIAPLPLPVSARSRYCFWQARICPR